MSAPVAIALRSRARSVSASAAGVRTEQGDVAEGDPVGDPAEAGFILRAEYGAPGDGDAHARIERARGQRSLPEGRAGHAARLGLRLRRYPGCSAVHAAAPSFFATYKGREAREQPHIVKTGW